MIITMFSEEIAMAGMVRVIKAFFASKFATRERVWCWL